MNDEMPTRARRAKRGKAAQALALEQEPNLIMRALLHSPKDTMAGIVATGGVLAIIINAAFLQAGRHPSPMFGSVTPTALVAAQSLQQARGQIQPQAQAQVQTQTSPSPQTLPSSQPQASSQTQPQPLPRARPVEARVAAAPNIARPPAAIPVRSDPVGDLIVATRRITLVQRALTEYGYGQLKPTGIIGPDTQAAIKKFETDRRRPPTGQMSDWLQHEIVKLTGRPLD